MLLVIGGNIISNISNILEAAITYVAAYYLLDFDYPKVHEMGLAVLQYICFDNKEVTAVLLSIFDVVLKGYLK